MTGSPIVLLLLLVAATAAFVFDRVPPDLVALTLLAALLVLRYVGVGEAFSGFGSPAIVILVAAFVFTGGLAKSGVSRGLGKVLLRVSRSRFLPLRAAIVLAAAGFSLVMNNVAAAALLLPGATEAGRSRRLPASKILMPLAFAVSLGGMATLLTTANIVVGGLLHQQGFRPLGLKDFLLVGGPLAVVGLVYLVLAAPRLLPDRSAPEDDLARRRGPERSLTQIYEMGRRLESVRILPGSPFAASTLGHSGLSTQLGTVVIAIVHADGTQRRAPEPTQPLVAGDILILDGVPPDRAVLHEAGLEFIRVKKPTRYLSSQRVALVEGVIAPRSRYAGKTLRELDFRGTHGGISVLSLWRNGAFVTGDLGEVPLQFGDALLMQGPRESFQRMRGEDDVVLLGHEDLAPAAPRRAGLTVAIVGVTLAAAAAMPTAVPAALFTGAVALLLARSITTEEAYRAVDWRSVVLVAAMLPLGIVLPRSGLAGMIADFAIRAFHVHGPLALLATFTVLAVCLTQLLPGGAAAPLVLGPIAITTAVKAGSNPYAFAMAVAMATSLSFVTPFSHPANVFVMGPGGYRFSDFVRFGLPLTVILTLGIIALVPFVYPL